MAGSIIGGSGRLEWPGKRRAGRPDASPAVPCLDGAGAGQCICMAALAAACIYAHWPGAAEAHVPTDMGGPKPILPAGPFINTEYSRLKFTIRVNSKQGSSTYLAIFGVDEHHFPLRMATFNEKR